MSWLNFFETKTPCNISFGRGINATISKDEEELFNKAYEAFEKKEILNAYEYFFKSLINYSNDFSNENIILHKDDKTLNFEMYQGCSKITGKITQEKLYAEVTIVKKEQASVALKRYILERNYQLTYSNYFSNDKYIKLKLQLDNITISPQKVFFPLRELALNADFDKEHIKSEFPNIKLQEISHTSKLEEKELKIKYESLLEWIDELDKKVLTLPSNDNAGMQAFLYLNILFKIDYLLVPKYKIYQKLTKKMQIYFGEENSTIEAKNEELRRYVSKLKLLSYDEFSENFYSAKYTFNPVEKTSYDELINFITDSLTKIKWYKKNRYAQIVPTIYSYIALYSLYNYSVNSALKELLHTLVEVQHPDYFYSLDCDVLYNTDKEEFSKRTITSKIDTIIENHQDKYLGLVSFSNELNFNSLNEFSNSYYLCLKNLDFEEA